MDAPEFDGPDAGSSAGALSGNVADANIGGTGPAPDVADAALAAFDAAQRTDAELASIAALDASLTSQTSAPSSSPTVAGVLREIGAFMGAVLGLASPSPAGKVSGAAYFADRISTMNTRSSSGTSSSVPNLAGSPVPGPVADGPGAFEASATFASSPASRPLIGWQGAIVGAPAAAAAARTVQPRQLAQAQAPAAPGVGALAALAAIWTIAQ